MVFNIIFPPRFFSPRRDDDDDRLGWGDYENQQYYAGLLATIRRNIM